MLRTAYGKKIMATLATTVHSLSPKASIKKIKKGERLIDIKNADDTVIKLLKDNEVGNICYQDDDKIQMIIDGCVTVYKFHFYFSNQKIF